MVLPVCVRGVLLLRLNVGAVILSLLLYMSVLLLLLLLTAATHDLLSTSFQLLSLFTLDIGRSRGVGTWWEKVKTNVGRREG